MVRYCEKCRDFHEANDMCPKYKEQLKQHPEWLAEAADFANVAAQQQLVATQALNNVCQAVNKVANTNLAFEGSQQAARDIQVFAKLNSDSFRLSGQFANAQTAKQTLEQSSEGFQRYLRGRLNGTGQEVDWLRSQQGKFSSLIKKASLPDGNTVGYDGEVIHRLSGKTVEKVTVKAAEAKTGLATNASDIVEAIKKGTLNPKDTVFGIEGIKEKTLSSLQKEIDVALKNGDKTLASKLEAAKEGLKFTEKGNFDSVKESTKRLTDKIAKGQANTTITPDMVASKAAQGAVIGAAISLTISGITNFIKYKNGEITRDEAFRDVGEDAVKGLITGAAMGAITLFLPVGAIGFVAGVAIGMYIGEVAGNVLDEVFGKGAYEQILNACGYVAGTAKNVVEMLGEFSESIRSIDKSNRQSHAALRRIEKKELSNKKAISDLNNILEDL